MYVWWVGGRGWALAGRPLPAAAAGPILPAFGALLVECLGLLHPVRRVEGPLEVARVVAGRGLGVAGCGGGGAVAGGGCGGVGLGRGCGAVGVLDAVAGGGLLVAGGGRAVAGAAAVALVVVLVSVQQQVDDQDCKREGIE